MAKSDNLVCWFKNFDILVNRLETNMGSRRTVVNGIAIINGFRVRTEEIRDVIVKRPAEAKRMAAWATSAKKSLTFSNFPPVAECANTISFTDNVLQSWINNSRSLSTSFFFALRDAGVSAGIRTSLVNSLRNLLSQVESNISRRG